MKSSFALRIATVLALALAVHAPATLAQDSDASEPPATSPDGAFKFVQHEQEDATDLKPPFNVIETATGRVVWSVSEDHAMIPNSEAHACWSPDSKRFVLCSRVGVRWVNCYFFAWNGKAFVGQKWRDEERVQTLVEAKMAAERKEAGVCTDAGPGRRIADELVPERWLDNNRVILTRSMVRVLEDADVEAIVRVLLKWDAKAKTFVIERALKPDEQPK